MSNAADAIGRIALARATGYFAFWLRSGRHFWPALEPEGQLRQWPVAGVLLLVLAVVLAGTMLTGH